MQAISQTSSGQVDFYLSFSGLQQYNCHLILCFVEVSYFLNKCHTNFSTSSLFFCLFSSFKMISRNHPRLEDCLFCPLLKLKNLIQMF